jgi:hypothetical protein
MKATHIILGTFLSLSVLGCSTTPTKHSESLDDPELKKIAAQSQLKWLKTADPKSSAMKAFAKNYISLLCFPGDKLYCPINGADVSNDFLIEHKFRRIIFFGTDGLAPDSELAVDATNYVKKFNRHMVNLVSSGELNNKQ